MTEEVVQAELEAQRRILEVEHQRKMAAIREEMENEVHIKSHSFGRGISTSDHNTTVCIVTPLYLSPVATCLKILLR